MVFSGTAAVVAAGRRTLPASRYVTAAAVAAAVGHSAAWRRLAAVCVLVDGLVYWWSVWKTGMHPV